MKTKPIIKNFLTRAAMTLAALLMTSASAWAGQKPITNLDVCRGEAYSIYVRGWAFDPDARDWGLDVKVYVYTDAACQNEYTYKKLATGDARSDVVAAHSLPNGSKPGFEGRIPITDPGTYYVKVYAIDIDQWGDNVANSSTEMSHSFNPVTVTTLTTIGSAAEWNIFVNAIKTGAEDFTGKTVKLTADIPTAAEIAAGTTAVTTITSEEKAFCGTFDGQGHTINVDLNVSGNEAAGLFSYVKGATIKNLTVTGTINNTGLYVGGLVGTAKGATIQNCTFAATINSSGDEVGAFVGGCNQIDANTPGNLTLQDCVFSGSIHYTGSFSCKAAGLVNVWNNTSLTIRNCLVSGSFTSERSGSQFYPIAFKTADATVTANVSATYYLNTLPVTTSGENVITDAEGLPVIANETEEYDVPVPAADGHTYYYYIPLTTVTSSTTEWTDGLYAVTNDVTISSRITVNGNVMLFLCEGVTLNARWGIGVGSGNTLTIEGPGTLQSGDTSGNASIGGTSNSAFGHIIINSGTIIASGGFLSAAIGGGEKNEVSNNSIIEINGGVVTATGGRYGAGIGSGYRGMTGVIIINGGQVTARGGQDASGIGRGVGSKDTSGSLTLGWTHESDFIDVDSYAIGSISFAEGKKFVIDGDKILATVENIGGKKIIPFIVNNRPSPTDLTVLDGTVKTATLTWTAPETDNTIIGYAYKYKNVNESTWSDEVTTTETSVTISGLTARTDYEFRVRTLYGSDTSIYEILKFTTALSLPYEQGFENGMDGWKGIDVDSDFGGPSSYTKYEGAKSYQFYYVNEDNKSKNQYLISPRLDGTTAISLSFYHISEYLNVPFQIGYSTSTDDITAFIWGDVLTAQINTWQLHTQDLPMGTRFVAVKTLFYFNVGSLMYLDNIIFKGANIKEPVNLVEDDVTHHSATLTWEAPETTNSIMGYDYQYKKASESDWTSGSTTETSVTISGLTAGAEYDFRVKALYSSDASIYVALRFHTAPLLPYEQGFENGMDGWKEVYVYSNNGSLDSNTKYEGAKSYIFKYVNEQYTSRNQYLISPRFDETTAFSLSFYYYSISNSDQFQIGYSTTTDDITAFTWGNVIIADPVWKIYTDNLPMGTKYVAFKTLFREKGASCIYLDNIIFKGVNIKEPVNLAVDEVSESSATLTWEAPETPYAIMGYDYQYKKASESDWTSGSTTETSVTISGLIAGAEYDFRVKALYSSDASIYVTLRFNTAPLLPYEQGFEDGLDGWKVIDNYPQGQVRIQTEEKHEGNNSIEYMFFSGSNGNEYLISPNFGGSTTGLRVSFYYLSYNISNQFQIGYSTTTNDITAFTWGDVQTTKRYTWLLHTEYLPEGTKYVAVKAFNTAGYTSTIYFDDFIVKDANIKEPVNLAVDEVSESSATLTWETPETPYTITGYDYQYKKASESDWTSGSTTGTSVTIDELSADTDYQFRVKALYDNDASIVVSLNFTTAISLPYEQGFENGMSHWEYSDLAYTGISESAKLNGENGFVFVKEQGNQYLISPRLSGTVPVVVTFPVRAVDGNSETFRVGYSTTDNSHFSYHTNLTIEGTYWYQYKGNFPAGTKYILIQYLATNNGLYIDDIVIKEKTYDITLDDNADNAAVINDYKGKCVNATLQDRTFYRDGDWNTLTVPFDVNDFTGTPLEGATVKTLSSSAFSNGTLTLNFEDATSIEAGKPYIVKWDEGVNLTINSTADWNAFAESVNGGKSFAGKTVLLEADINVSTMVGTAEHPFSGTFEGAGHTLNVSISGGNGAAPFRYISGATIRNVKTSGSVNGGNYSAGLVGFALGGTNRIRDCYVTATVNTSGSYIGGILGNGTTSTTTISNCMFSGYLAAANMGILYGWGEEGGTHTVENCVASGTYADLSIIIDEGEGRSIDLLLGNGTKTVANCWKNKDVGSQGNTDVYTWSGGTHPLIYNYLGSQWTYENNNFVLSPTVNIVGTNIENPTFVDVRISTTASPVETTWVDFVGTYEPLSFSDADPSILFLGTESTLYYPLSGAYIGAQRAYFQLKGIEAGDTHNQARAFVLNFGDSETTGILSTTNLTNYTNSDTWYDLSGRRLNGKPTQKGLYINNGRKVVIK